MTDRGGSERAIVAPEPPPSARDIFGARLDDAVRYVAMLAAHGVERGLIGPREVDRLWERHILNSAVVAELIDEGARVADVGSGAGFPGVPLALARPDLDVVLVEPMERRVRWLNEVREALGLRLSVVRGRAEDREVRRVASRCDVATARAVAPLARLAEWCLPLVRPGGRLLALKGQGAEDEVARDRGAIARAGGVAPRVKTCGRGMLEVPTIVVVVQRCQEPVGATPSGTRPAGGRNRASRTGRGR